jgi:hypothetical protein
MNTKTCGQCGKTFHPDPRKGDKQKFCGRACWIESRKRQVQLVCERCGRQFSVYQARATKARFCSWECHKTIREYPCAYCGKPYSIKSSAAPKRRTCSRSCRARLQAAEGRSPHQGKTRPHATREKVSIGLKRHYGGDPSKHPNYKGGPGAIRKGDWLKQRAIARARDGNTCQCCLLSGDAAGKNLPVHHIRPYREFESPAEANELSNLITVCQPCHMRLERGTMLLIPQSRAVACPHPSGDAPRGPRLRKPAPPLLPIFHNEAEA